MRPRLAKKARLRWDARERSLLLLYPERGLVLNDTAAAIVRMCDGSRTTDEIARAIAEETGDPVETVAPEVTRFLEELRSRALVEDGAHAPPRSLASHETSPLEAGATDVPRPFTLIAELTHLCPLRCAYCSNPRELTRSQEELTTDEWARVFAEGEALGVVQVHLTGGEPLLRKDLEQLAARARSLGLYTNLITSGLPLERGRLALLKEAGVDNVQVSFQDVDRAVARAIAGRDALDDKIRVARWVKELGLPLTVNVVLHRANLDRLPDFVALAEDLGADRLELANTQYHGWAFANRAALLPSAEQLARAEPLARAAKERLAGKMEVLFVKPDYFGDRPKACMDGWGRRFVHVTPSGKVLPCHAAEVITSLSFESARQRSLSSIWNDSLAFNLFRGDGWMREPCKSCDRRSLDFGGCRCQAFQLTGRAEHTDPACALSPEHDIVVRARKGEPKPPVYLYRGRT
jgi:PqqA peptide cyclase